MSTSSFASRGPVSLNCLTSVISISFYFSAVMYTLIPGRLLSAGAAAAEAAGGEAQVSLCLGEAPAEHC